MQHARARAASARGAVVGAQLAQDAAGDGEGDAAALIGARSSAASIEGEERLLDVGGAGALEQRRAAARRR